MGLVLAGGKSTRMGQDKSLLNYHGTTQRDHVRQLLLPFCENVFISVKHRSAHDPKFIIADGPLLGDIGPMAGLLTAFRQFPDYSWIAVGCDYPFLENKTIEVLQKGESSTYATAFINTETQRPEPLLTIYRPSILPLVEESFSNSHYSLQRLLETIPITLLHAEVPAWLLSVDTPEQVEKIRKRPL